MEAFISSGTKNMTLNRKLDSTMAKWIMLTHHSKKAVGSILGLGLFWMGVATASFHSVKTMNRKLNVCHYVALG